MASPSPEAAAWARAKTESLFYHWLSSEQGFNFVKNLCEDVKAGKPVSAPANAAASAPSPVDVSQAGSPQRSIRKSLSQEDALLSSPGGSTGSVDSPSGKSARGSSVQRKRSGLSVTSSVSSGGGGGSPLASPTSASVPPALAMSSNQASSSSSSIESIPSFYGKNRRKGKQATANEDSLEAVMPELQEVFSRYPEGITAEQLLPICKNLVDFPSALNVPLFRRIRMMNRIWNNEPVSSNAKEVAAAIEELAANPKYPFNPATLSMAEEEQLIELETGQITLDELSDYWKREVEPFDREERFFRLLKQPDAKYITAKDFFPIVRELIDGHPGLEFLENTPEFQEKYARTVVARIMHRVNTSWTGEITLRELCRSDLLHYLGVADDEEEINAINEYFSYEHFYVIYCKFWELDSDHDFLLSREDIFRHGAHSLTKNIVDRIFQQPCKVFSSGVKGKMGFEDFCFFILCEEDKTNATSIRYWFHLVDLDGDGFLRKWEVRSFYDEQLKRMRSLGHEEVLLDDIYSQMKDCLGRLTGKSILFAEGESEEKDDDEDDEWKIGLKEFLKPDRLEISGQFFNLLFNLNKFIANESRDPFSTRLMQGEQPLTDWDRYALAEYSRLASAEEARGSAGGGGGGGGGNAQSSYNTGGGNSAGAAAVFSTAGSLASRMIDSDSGSEEDEEEDEADERDANADEDELNDSEDSGDFNTKGLNSGSPLFSSNGLFPVRDDDGGRIRQLSDEVSEGDLDRSMAEYSEDGMEPLERTQLSAICYAPTEEDWRRPDARYNVAPLWLAMASGE